MAEKIERKRGRPRKDSLFERIQLGLEQDCKYTCDICQALFPRSKSLNAHKRTHTGECPYACTYPRCGESFKQSGQLKTHMYRHTGEMLYVCPAEGCSQRFKHSNRECKTHPGKLIKDGLEEIFFSENIPHDEVMWINEYKANKGKPLKRIKSPALFKSSNKRAKKTLKSEKESSPDTSYSSSSSASLTSYSSSSSASLTSYSSTIHQPNRWSMFTPSNSSHIELPRFSIPGPSSSQAPSSTSQPSTSFTLPPAPTFLTPPSSPNDDDDSNAENKNLIGNTSPKDECDKFVLQCAQESDVNGLDSADFTACDGLFIFWQNTSRRVNKHLYLH